MRHATWLMLPFMLGACSLMIGEKPSGRPCDPQGMCPADQHCENNICVQGVVDLCRDANCAPGEICDPATGICSFDDPCENVTCGLEEICCGSEGICCGPDEFCDEGSCEPVVPVLTPCDPSETDLVALHATCKCAGEETVRCRSGGPSGGECLCLRLMGRFGGLSRTPPLGIKERRLMEARLGPSCAPVAGSGIQVCGGITQ